MTPRHLEIMAATVIRQTLEKLPADLQNAIQSCSIETAWMSACLAAGESEIDADLLGLFEGRAHGDEDGLMLGMGLSRIRLFLDNLWEFSGRHRETYREEVRLTLLHELGHYLGLDEEQVAARGLA